MRLLDRYQLRELFLALGYCLGGILVFWMAFELLGEMEELARHDLDVTATVLYLFHRLPLHLLLQVPVALLLALLYALAQHSRHHELVAMRSAGISVWRLSAPYLGTGIVLSLGMVALNEYVVPDAATRAAAVLESGGSQDGPAALGFRENLNFRDPLTGRSWSLVAYNLATTELRGVHIQWPGASGSREELLAESGHWEDDAWVFERVTRFSFPASPTDVEESFITNRLVVRDFPETPDHLRSEVKISGYLGSLKKSRKVQLSLREILVYRELHPRLSPQFEALLATWFHDRLASPWVCLVVVLVAIPAAGASGRRSVFLGVAAAVFLAFSFFVVKEFCLATGSGGYLPPWLAAWLPNLLYGGLGVARIQRLR